MAKLGKINQNNRRVKMAQGQRAKRASLKAQQRELRGEASLEQMMDISQKLAKMPRNGAKNRFRLRCELTGRPRGNYRKLK
ncbi:MAG: 30S ribosomal protein S14, partial [Alphaproteobacteria bacterium]|nr:30S ribosomal protein S14 [Alphaproteobacteria bacterium]